MSKPSKARVRAAFEKAAGSYDQAAEVQRRICDRLLAGLPPHAVDTLLDAGCGTGYALPALGRQFPGAIRLALDLSPGMLARVPAPNLRLAGDLEHLPLADATLDLYWSSLAIQWCELPKVLGEARRVLRPGGWLAVATLGPGTFGELRSAFASIDTHRHTIAFLSPAEIEACASAAGWSDIRLAQHTELAHYPQLRDLLRAVKAVGANQLGEGRRTALLSRQAFKQLETAYEQFRTEQGLSLSYDVISIYARA